MTAQNPQPRQTTEPPTFLVHQWIAAGIVSASARFIPIPFIDDIVRGQCRRFVISMTLSHHKAQLQLEQWKPYYAGSSGCLAGCALRLATAPLKLLLFPIRKLVAVLTSIREVPLEILRVVLLGRTLDRYLREGRITTEPTVIIGVADRMRVAFEEAFARIDFHVVRATMNDALSGVRGWRAAAIAAAKSLASPQATPKDDLQSDPKLNAGADRVHEVLARPETLELFAKFDHRFDEAFNRLA